MSLASQEWSRRRTAKLFFRRPFGIDSVDTEISNITLGAFAECLEDKVADSEVLDLFKTALATLDNGEYSGRTVQSKPNPSPHPRHREENKSEGENCNRDVEDHNVRICDRSTENKADSV